jgi:hypothetical protein
VEYRIAGTRRLSEEFLDSAHATVLVGIRKGGAHVPVSQDMQVLIYSSEITPSFADRPHPRSCQLASLYTNLKPARKHTRYRFPQRNTADKRDQRGEKIFYKTWSLTRKEQRTALCGA